MSNSTNPGDVPEIPNEVPKPFDIPEIAPTTNPETPLTPKEEPVVIPTETPFQPDIPNEIPPFKP